MRGIEWLPLDKPSIQNGNPYSAERQNIHPFAHLCRETQQSCHNSVNSKCSADKYRSTNGADKLPEPREKEGGVMEGGSKRGGGSQQHLYTLTHCKERNPAVSNRLGCSLHLVVRAAVCDHHSNLSGNKLGITDVARQSAMKHSQDVLGARHGKSHQGVELFSQANAMQCLVETC